MHFEFAKVNSYILSKSTFRDHKVNMCGMRLPEAVKTRDQFNQNSYVFVDKLNSLFEN